MPSKNHLIDDAKLDDLEGSLTSPIISDSTAPPCDGVGLEGGRVRTAEVDRIPPRLDDFPPDGGDHAEVARSGGFTDHLTAPTLATVRHSRHPELKEKCQEQEQEDSVKLDEEDM